MPVLLSLLLALRTLAHSRAALQFEILALRHQLAVLQRTRPRRVPLAKTDRWLWVMLSRLWAGWPTALVIVKPETVIAWHRRGFRLWWTWKSRCRLGRPTVPADVRTLIRRMAQANPRWGAPRMHGELLKLGIDLCQATVAKYMGRPRQPSSQTWRTFLQNHIGQIVAADFFVVPTVTYRLVFVLVLLAHDRRRIRHVAVTAHPTAAWTAQQRREAFPWDEAPRYLIHDRDHLFNRLGATAKVMGIEEVLTAPRAPWQKCIRRAICGVRSSRVFRSRDRVQRSGRAEADDALLFVLRTIPDSPLAEQGRADSPHDHATRRGRHRGDPRGRGPSSSVRTATTRHHPAATTTRQPSHRERRDRRDTLDLTSHPHFDTRSGRRARRHQHLPTGITDRRRARRADHGRNELVGWQIGFLVGDAVPFD